MWVRLLVTAAYCFVGSIHASAQTSPLFEGFDGSWKVFYSVSGGSSFALKSCPTEIKKSDQRSFAFSCSVQLSSGKVAALNVAVTYDATASQYKINVDRDASAFIRTLPLNPDPGKGEGHFFGKQRFKENNQEAVQAASIRRTPQILTFALAGGGGPRGEVLVLTMQFDKEKKQ